MKTLYKIGVMSKMTGVSHRRIRHYEKIGLISALEAKGGSYRLFDDQTLERLKHIDLLRGLDFSLKEIESILNIDDNAQISSIFEVHLMSLQKDIESMTKKRDLLEAVMETYKVGTSQHMNNMHVMKELITMNGQVMKIFNNLEVEVQIRILKDLYRTGTLSKDTLEVMQSKYASLFLEELHLLMVKALLQGTDKATEKNIMETLENKDPDFFHVATGTMFTFSDLVKLPDRTLSIWGKHCKDEDLVMALKGSGQYLQDKILSNLPEGRASQLRQEVSQGGRVSMDKTFQAMHDLIEVLKVLEKRGEVLLQGFGG